MIHKLLKSILCILPLVVVCNLTTSCGIIVKSMARKNLTVEKGAIPPEFGKEKTTILFIKARGGYNGYLRRNVRKNYNGAYELVTRAEYENNAKYQDVTTYRYVFDFDYYRVNDRYISPALRSL